MTLFRVVHNKNYTCINNHIATDKNLSWKAKGIWLYAFSRPDDWQFHLNDLINQSTDGREAITSGLKELENFGYLERQRKKNDEGQFTNTEWTFFEMPRQLKEKVPQTENPLPVNPVAENRPLLSTDKILSTERKQQQATPSAPDAAVSSDISKDQQQQAKAGKANASRPRIYECLQEIDIPESDKREVTLRYDENTVKNAIAYATNPETKITKGLVQAIKWACQNKPEVPKSRNDTISANKEWAKQYDGCTNGISRVTVLNKFIEIDFGTPYKPAACIEYTENNFKDQVHNALKKGDLPIVPSRWLL